MNEKIESLLKKAKGNWDRVVIWKDASAKPWVGGVGWLVTELTEGEYDDAKSNGATVFDGTRAGHAPLGWQLWDLGEEVEGLSKKLLATADALPDPATAKRVQYIAGELGGVAMRMKWRSPIAQTETVNAIPYLITHADELETIATASAPVMEVMHGDPRMATELVRRIEHLVAFNDDEDQPMPSS